jgi:hypothetical protein
MRRPLALVVLLVATFPPAIGAAQKGGGLPAPPKLGDPHAKLGELVAGIVKKQDEQASVLKKELEKSAIQMKGAIQQAVAKAGLDLEPARLDLEAASKEVDAAVRRKRLADAMTKHGAKLAAASAIARPLAAPELAKLPGLGTAGAGVASTGWTAVGTPPASPSAPYTYERSFISLPETRLSAKVDQGSSLAKVYVEALLGYDDKAAKAGFEQSFTVPAGVKSFEISAKVVAQGNMYSVAGVIGYVFAELRGFMAVTGLEGQCTAEQQLWEHRGIVFDYFSGPFSAPAVYLTCRIDRSSSTAASTYWMSAGASERVGVGASGAVAVDTDGNIPGVSLPGAHEIHIDTFRWRALSN